MKAALLEAPGQLLRICEDLEIDEPRMGQLLVKVTNCGICHSDLSLVDGTFPAPLPIVLGHEAAGVVEAIGPGVDGIVPGDHVVLTPCPPCGRCYWCVRGETGVCVDAVGIQTHAFRDGTTGLSRRGERVYRGLNVGAFAEYVVTQATGAVKIPSDVPLDVACVVGCAVQTGVGAVLNTARVEEGSTVLVVGLGGVGLSVVQGARLAGASRIAVSDPVEARREAARSMGATDLLDPGSEDIVARSSEISEVGFDYAFETAGSGSLIQQCIRATRKGGTTVCVGAPPIGDEIAFAPAAVFVIQEKKLFGCVLGSCNSLHEIPRLVSLWRAGRLDLTGLITARKPLAQVNQALGDLKARRGIRTVLCL